MPLSKAYLIILFLLPIALLAQNTQMQRMATIKVDKMPQYPAGNKALAQKFLNVIDPPSVKWEEVDDSDLRNELILSMVVTESGTIEHVQVLKSLNARNDAKCVAVAKTLKFNPALQNGKPVTVTYILPLNFDF